MKEWFKENKWTFFGWNVIGLAILAPTLLLIFRDLIAIDFNGLGPIGDFFGGTTVGLLTLASMLFVISSISMQRKQLDMQQDDLKIQRKELAKTRKEFELTNKTLTKQQFESTFFNMINLHHNLLKDLEGRREYFNKNYNDLIKAYKLVVGDNWTTRLSLLKESDLTRLKQLLQTLYLYERKIGDLDKKFNKHWDAELDENLISKLESENDKYFINNLSKLKEDFEMASLKDRLNQFSNDSHILDYFLYKNKVRMEFSNNFGGGPYTITVVDFFERINDVCVVNFMKQIRNETLLQPSSLKRVAYEKLYKEKEEEIGHYYRNLYRIIRFIHDEQFSNNSKENEKEKKKYIDILRAQLSSMELLMLFYNVVYSKKGEKFKEILKGTNFFDDHLIESKFLWANDKEELAALN
ncbi:putative phage abortive infection protein [Bacillus altitudinis]|uniref:putative phage abortive infection protein n=1 Tax=Bacillus altitudinis TaxID=293387 RepID=UPI0015B7B8BA|nr:putative phage abortive infection protein [Bacillus altitudinis]